MTKIIAEFPAIRVFEMPEFKRNRIRHNDKFVVMYQSSSYGMLPRVYTFGSVFGYAVENGDDVLDRYLRAKANGHKIHWANADDVVLHDGPKTQVDRYALQFGDMISFEGKKYRIDKAPNDNVALTEIE